MTKNEYKAAAKVTFGGIYSAIQAALAGIARVEEEAAKAAAVFEVQAGMALDSARIEFAAAKAAGVSLAKTAGIGTDDWRVYGRENIPGKDNGTLYRWQNAGAVAKVLGDELVPGTLVTSLSYLYRGLETKTKATDEARAAAEDLVREVYREAVEAAGTDDDGNALPPAREDLLARVEAAFPTNRSGGSSGSTTPPVTTTDDDDDEDDEESDESRRSDTVAVASAAAVELANGPTDSIFRGLVAEYGVPRSTVVGIALAVLRLAEEHGPTTIQAVILAAGTDETTDDDEDVTIPSEDS